MEGCFIQNFIIELRIGREKIFPSSFPLFSRWGPPTHHPPPFSLSLSTQLFLVLLLLLLFSLKSSQERPFWKFLIFCTKERWETHSTSSRCKSMKRKDKKINSETENRGSEKLTSLSFTRRIKLHEERKGFPANSYIKPKHPPGPIHIYIYI